MNQVENVTKEEVIVKLPSKYNVIMHNDQITPMGFVIEILVNVFSYSHEDAVNMMLNIHEKGKGIVGTYIKSIAESKVNLVRDVAIKAGYPLNTTIEQAN